MQKPWSVDIWSSHSKSINDSGEIWIAQNIEANIRINREISMEAKTFLEGKKNPAQNGKPQAHAALAIQVLPMQL